MKRLYYKRLATMLMLVFVGGAMFSSCIKKPAAREITAQDVDVTYHFEGGGDMSQLFDIYATYSGVNGKSVTERVWVLPWSMTVSARRPFNAQFKVELSSRTGFSEKPLYDVGFDGFITHSPMQEGDDKVARAPIQQQTRAGGESLKLRFIYPDEAAAQAATLRVAPLRYDKHFAFTLTIDDCWTNAWSQLWSQIHAKWVDDHIYHHLDRPRTTGYTPEYPLVMTDGCGNDRRFGFSCALWPSWGNTQNKTYIKDLVDTGDKSIYLSWEELGLMSDFGVSMLYHNVDERVWDKTNVANLKSGLMEDFVMVTKKLGIRMKIMGLPDGNVNYLEAARQSDLIAFTRSSLGRNKIYLNSCGDLYKMDTYGGDSSQEVTAKMAALAEQHLAANPFWVAMTIHGPKAEHAQMLKDIYELYGKAGSDDLWVASWDEVYEYVSLREWAASRITRTVEGRTVTFDIPLPNSDGFLYQGLTFLADGAQMASVEPASGNIVGLNSAPRGEALLVDVAFGDRLMRLSDKYTDLYEIEPTVESRADALYFVDQLLPDLAKPFEERIKVTPKPAEGQITLKGVQRYQAKWNGYKHSVGQKFEKLP